MSKNQELAFRTLDQNDGAKVARLIEQSPDTGSFHFSPHYRIDAIETFNLAHGRYHGIVVESPNKDQLVGMCLVQIQDLQFNGTIRANSYINSLVVHPDYRKRGIAHELVRRIVDYSHNELGEDSVIWAAIQDGNTGSERTFRTYLEGQLNRRLLTLSLKTRAKALPNNSKYSFRPIQEQEVPLVIDELNQFYREYNFYPPQSVDKLRNWLSRSPFEDQFRHYRVVQDQTGQIVAGAAITEQFRIREMHVEGIPFVLRFLNNFLHYVPFDGNLREVVVSKHWFSPRHAEAASYLLEMIRWEWRESASTVLLPMDAKSPMFKAIHPKAWLPKGVASLFTNSISSMNPDDMVYF